jgi:antirestriction protein ArdC
MNDNRTSKNHSQELLGQVTARIEELAKLTDAALVSREMLHYLDTMARFHHYSLHNCILIMSARPFATMVAGFQTWRELGRYVRKGEHGIAILAPVLVQVGKVAEEAGPTENEPRHLMLRGFKTVYVFDISQTEGDPLPEPPNWKDPEKDEELHARLLAFARARGITVKIGELGLDVQGLSRGGSIELAPEAGTKTLIHELAHEIMHHRPDAPKERAPRELEAESVAYVVGKHFGLEGAGSPNYVALHHASSELIMEHLRSIQATAVEIIRALELRGGQPTL